MVECYDLKELQRLNTPLLVGLDLKANQSFDQDIGEWNVRGVRHMVYSWGEKFRPGSFGKGTNMQSDETQKKMKAINTQ